MCCKRDRPKKTWTLTYLLTPDLHLDKDCTKKTARHVNWSGMMPWITVHGKRRQRMIDDQNRCECVNVSFGNVSPNNLAQNPESRKTVVCVLSDVWGMAGSFTITTLKLLQPFCGSLKFVWDNLGELYQKKHSPTHTYQGHQSSFILHLLQSMAASLLNARAWQSLSTISPQVFIGLPVGLAPFTSYSIHFFTQSLSSFRRTCPYHRNLFCCSTEIMWSNPSPYQPFTRNCIL